jgi:rhodanese-related sulfurtransferase
MDQFSTFVNFIIEHWELAVLFVVLLLACVANEVAHRSFGIPCVGPQKAVYLINHQRALVVDIRQEEAFAKGHIVGSMNVPSLLLESKLNVLKKQLDIPVIVVCTNGQESAKVAKILKTQGFKALYRMQGGLQAWKEADLPLVKK